jgi:hypothetical protein
VEHGTTATTAWLFPHVAILPQTLQLLLSIALLPAAPPQLGKRSWERSFPMPRDTRLATCEDGIVSKHLFIEEIGLTI